IVEGEGGCTVHGQAERMLEQLRGVERAISRGAADEIRDERLAARQPVPAPQLGPIREVLRLEDLLAPPLAGKPFRELAFYADQDTGFGLEKNVEIGRNADESGRQLRLE